MTTKLRKTAVLLVAAFWLTLAVIFAGVFVIAEHDHEHINAAGRHLPTGENCRVCIEIQIALRLIEAVGRLGVSFVLAGFIVFSAAAAKPQAFFLSTRSLALKVKFNC